MHAHMHRTQVGLILRRYVEFICMHKVLLCAYKLQFYLLSLP